MKHAGTLKHFVFALLIAVAVYFSFYTFIENRRTRTGPWRVTFTNEAAVPTLIINEPKLNLADLKITFPRAQASSASSTLIFDQPQPVPFDVPFGQCIFEDTTFQPGTVVFALFGHEIQLLPRALTIDKTDYAWQSHATLSLSTTNTSPGAP